MNFNYNTFAKQLDGYPGMDVKNEHDNYGWVQWDKRNTDDFNKVVYYKFKNNDNEFEYETWHQETSLVPGAIGMMASCKIDFNRTTGDDHIIMMAGYNADGSMNFAQALVQFHGSEENNIITSQITSGDIPQGVFNAIKAGLKDSYGHIDDSTEGRHTLPDIAKANLLAMAAAVSK